MAELALWDRVLGSANTWWLEHMTPFPSFRNKTMKKWVTQASMRILPVSNAWSQNLQFWKIVESWKWGKRTWTVQLKVLALPPHLHHSLPFPSYWLVSSNAILVPTEATEEDRKYLDLVRWKFWMRRVRHGEGMEGVGCTLWNTVHPPPSIPPPVPVLCSKPITN